MKKIVFILITFSLAFVITGCQDKDDDPEPAPPPAKTTLNVTITEHPEGGNNINQVSAQFEGKILGKVTPCSVTVEWWWENGNHENPSMKSSEEILFNSANVTSKSTIYKAPVGYILNNYYWVKFKWTDDDGQHELETSKAFCTNK